MPYCRNKTAVVLSVENILPRLKSGSQLTMIITPGTSVGFFVTTAIEELLDDTVKRPRRSFKKRTTI